MAIQDISNAQVFLGCYIKRLSSSLGLNSSPSSIELELVPGDPTNAIDLAGTNTGGIPATGFDYANALPGKMSGFRFGALKFAGIIESYTENYSTQGLTYQVRMVDPRIIFKNINFCLDGLNSIPSGLLGVSGITNYFDILHFYGNPTSADINTNGVTYSKLKPFLESTGIFYKIYDRTFQITFGSGFMFAPTGGVNLGLGIPEWYRVPASTLSLDEVLQKLSSDFLLDYYVNVDFDAWSANPNSIINLNIETINRADATGTGGPGNALSTYVTNVQNSGLLISYRKGKELRSDPNGVIIKGPSRTYWTTPNSIVSEMTRFWGYYDRGFAITTNIDSNHGAVILDHIIGNKAAVITNQIPIQGIYYQKVATGSIYPPTITKITTSLNVSGYHPSDLTMRAALHSQESWESILYEEDPTFANQIGIVRQRFRDRTNYASILSSGGLSIGPRSINLSIVGSGITNRSNSTEALINAVYEATKSSADQFYGRSWMVKLGSSAWLQNNVFQGTEYTPPIEFQITDSAWSEGANLINPSEAIAYPYNVTNHELLHSYSNPIYKDNQGRLRAFVSFPDYTTQYISSTFGYPLDLEQLPRESVFIEQGPKLVLPIEAQHYALFPASGIVTLPSPISALINPTGYDNQSNFYEFLLAMNYSHTDIVNWKLMDKADDNSNYGLVAPRIPYIKSAPENYGIHIPLVNKLVNYGPFCASGIVPGGSRIVEDPNLAPWNFGSDFAMRRAGVLSATIASTPITIIDNADLQIAGLPEFSLGQFIGESTNITAITMQYGVDGLTTSYSLRTFAHPPFKVQKQLSDRLLSVLLDVQKIHKDLINIDKVKDEEINKLNILINRPSRVELADGESRKKFNTESNLYLTGRMEGLS